MAGTDDYTFNGWVVFTRGTAHALYVDPEGEPGDSLAFLCGSVFYDLFESEIPHVPGMDVNFCTNCVRISKHRKDRALQETASA